MKKILFPTEFADHAPDALSYVFELAKRFKAKVVVLHVYGKPESAFKLGKVPGEMADYMMDVLTDFVVKNKPAKTNNIKEECMVEMGFPAEVILKVASREDIDLVVMGTTGKTGAGGMMFGSVSTAVLKDADAPVLLIPPGYKYRWFHKIVYTTDFAFRDIGVLLYLEKMARVFNAEVDCLHIVEKGEDELRAKINMELLEKTFGKRKAFFQFDVVEGRLAGEINDYLDEENAGLVVMLSVKEAFGQKLQSGAEQMKLLEKSDYHY